MRQLRVWVVLILSVFYSGWAWAQTSGSGMSDFWRPEWTARLIRSGFILLIGFVLFKMLKLGIARISDKISQKGALRESEHTLQLKTLLQLVNWTGSILIVGMVSYMLLEGFGINMAPLLAGAGIAGLAFGFGGQYLIRDIINGIFILLEGQFRLQDTVQIDAFTGVVESVNLRHTRLRDAEGRVIYSPNGEIKTVVNLTKEYARAVIDVGVAYKENLDQVMGVIKEIGAEMRRDDFFSQLILEEMEMLGVSALADSQVIVQCRFKTLPSKQADVAREFRRRVKNRFDELGIEIPFPHQTLYFGTAKDNDFLRQSFSKKS